eukprot:GHVL01010935.1.p1 GENE.GHVL01010935.1~~GHVL01010935.1.p1  ORF type:complete len:223 (-),score=13.17 GHVL01010935.1:264-932(-)
MPSALILITLIILIYIFLFSKETCSPHLLLFLFFFGLLSSFSSCFPGFRLVCFVGEDIFFLLSSLSSSSSSSPSLCLSTRGLLSSSCSDSEHESLSDSSAAPFGTIVLVGASDAVPGANAVFFFAAFKVEVAPFGDPVSLYLAIASSYTSRSFLPFFSNFCFSVSSKFFHFSASSLISGTWVSPLALQRARCSSQNIKYELFGFFGLFGSALTFYCLQLHAT